MREIKFRVFDRKEKRMDYDQELIFDYLKPSNYFFKENFERFGNVMQLTGIYDKDNKNIYEGDIITDGSLNSTQIGTINYVIEYDDRFGSYGFRGELGLQPFTWEGDVYESKKFKVIGNVFENKDLLK